MEIRWLKPEEYADAFKLVQDRAGWMESPSSMLLGQFEKGELVGVVGVTRPYVIEPIVMKDGFNPKNLIISLDQRLDPNRYFFFVKDERFQKYIDRAFEENVEGWQGKLYSRVRNYGSTQGKQGSTDGIQESSEPSERSVRPATGGQGEDSSAGFGADGSGDFSRDFSTVSSGSEYSWSSTARGIK
jgi:hypothetical protein